jgi:catechol 2,3-dioxygenase-like lactoylglutathione lyase family enzyme
MYDRSKASYCGFKHQSCRRGDRRGTAQARSAGDYHFFFTMPDATALLEELLAKGVPLAGRREAFTKAQGQVRSFYVHDPDGTLMRFNGGLNEG